MSITSCRPVGWKERWERGREIESSNLSGQLLLQGFGIKESFSKIPVGMETTLSRAQDPWHSLGWLTWRGDLVRHAVRWLLPNVPIPLRTSRRIRVLGTKLQERPRAGLNLFPSLSRVKWLVTCRKGQRPMTAVQRTPALPLHCADKKSEISDSPGWYKLQLNLELRPRAPDPHPASHKVPVLWV